jgi:hypothetical protein
VAQPVAYAALHRGAVGGCSVRASSTPWWCGWRRPACFSHLQRYGGEVDVGRAGTPASLGSSDAAAAVCMGWSLAMLGGWSHGESFTHLLGR